MKKKGLVIALSVMLVLCLAVGGTLAWLSAKTTTVTNTFTVGDIDITLAETTGETYKMVPGNDIKKDPKATVLANSEACWLFVKVEKLNNFDSYLTYEMADGWTELEAGVYYREVSASTADQGFAVINDDTVKVLGTVDKGMMEAIEKGQAQKPQLKITAYAVQRANFDNVADAWTEAQKLS